MMNEILCVNISYQESKKYICFTKVVEPHQLMVHF